MSKRKSCKTNVQRKEQVGQKETVKEIRGESSSCSILKEIIRENKGILFLLAFVFFMMLGLSLPLEIAVYYQSAIAIVAIIVRLMFLFSQKKKEKRTQTISQENTESSGTVL